MTSKNTKITKKPKLNSADNVEKIIQNGKANKRSGAKQKATSSITTDAGSKKAAKLVEMVHGTESRENAHSVQKPTSLKNVKPKTPKEAGAGLTDVQTKKPKNKKNKKAVQPTQENSSGGQQDEVNIETNKELSEADLKKIAKKKAKKAAQKLKKAERKLMISSGDPTAENNVETNSVMEKPKKKLKKVKENVSNQKAPTRALINKTDSTVLEKDAPTDVSDRVLSKKDRKQKKRQILKEKKLEAKSTRSPAEQEATVFVGNVPVNTKRVQLVKLFVKCGPVDSIRLRSASGKVLHKHKMRKAAGSLNAYVVLQTKGAAEKALELNGVEFKGNHLRITKSTKNPDAQKDNDQVKRTIFVGNLKYSATEESLREIFTSCGDIESVRCIRDGDKGCKGVAYVCFRQADAVGLALELKDTILDERPIHVERYSVSKLGAKEQRDAQAVKEKNVKLNKSKKSDKVSMKSNNKKDGDASKKSKKSEFRGVKVDGFKKKNKSKKIKNSQAAEMAKKIAPKVKN